MSRLVSKGITQIPHIKIIRTVRSFLLVCFLCLVAHSALAAPSDHFVTTWKTDIPFTPNNTSITIPIMGGPYEVDWNNDGVFDEFGLYGKTTHDFQVAGTYTIRIQGTYDAIKFQYYYGLWESEAEPEKILSVDQWGTNSWQSMLFAFYGTVNLTIPAIDTPDFSAVSSMGAMFEGATLVNPLTSNWDTSSVTSMARMFRYAASANPDTSNWDTSAVTSMGYMFAEASSANPDTSNWDTSAVTNMSDMFAQASSAIPDTSNWDTSSVTTMHSLFSRATSASPDTSRWDTSSVTDMNFMFHKASSANPDTSKWDTSSVTDLGWMFWDATSANPDTSNWDTSSVTGIVGITWMFRGATSANPDISNWDLSSVTSMSSMFQGATSFDRDLGSLDISSIKFASSMFASVTLSTPNYDSLLIGWSSQLLNTGVEFDGGNSTYCTPDAAAARAKMIATYSWSITDGGHSCPPDDSCNVNQVWGDTVNSPVSDEACEILTLGPSFTAAAGADVSLSSGWVINLLPGFKVEQGATLNANVCGQSLCMTSDNPMPYGCHSCVTAICDLDSYCCNNMFDSICLSAVDTVCGLVCEE